MTYNSLAELFTAIANSIRGKTGGTEKIVANDFPAAIDGISSGGGDEGSVLDNFIAGNPVEITSNATKVADNTFYQNTSITAIRVPIAASIGTNAFYKCTKLALADAQNATSIGTNAFYGSAIETANFPNATSIGNAAFQACVSLKSVNFPKVTAINTNAFYACHALTEVTFPSAEKIYGDTAFYYCMNLVRADFAVLTSIYTNAFHSCSKLTALILRNAETVCSLSGTNAFASTPIANGTGYIYVPSALTDSYKAATNWSTFATKFRALEDYTVDGTTTGELDSTKI